MDQVLAKVKGNAKKKIFKLLSDQTLFEDITVESEACVDYDADHNLDEETWFKIDNFSAQPYCIDLLKNEFDSKDYDDLVKNQFSRIAYICAVQDNDFYFQKITPSLFLAKKSVVFGEAAKLDTTDNRLVINPLPDAIYLKDSDTLVFRKLATISSIFKGIDILYKEATKEEVSSFLDESFIELSDGYDINKVSKPNRKRIALAKNTLDGLSDDERGQMLEYIQDYCGGHKLNFDGDNGKFEIKTDDELKYLLYGIEQRFYTTPLGQERRLANSVQSLD